MYVKIHNYARHFTGKEITDKIFWFTAWGNPENRVDVTLGKIQRPKWADRLDDVMEPVAAILTKLAIWARPDDKVIIHLWDTYSMDHTLAIIILPMLKQLKAEKHGGPHVDDSDVPVELRVPVGFVSENGDVDPNWFARWDYVMDEMIYAFTKIIESENWDTSYMNTEDIESVKAVEARIQNGLVLFGRYFRSLWD